MELEEKRIPTENQKFCKHCGEVIDKDCVICPKCGKQVEDIKAEQPSVVINNTNTNANANVNVNGGGGRMRNKWTAFFLCLFLGGFRINSTKERRAWGFYISSLSVCLASAG